MKLEEFFFKFEEVFFKNLQKFFKNFKKFFTNLKNSYDCLKNSFKNLKNSFENLTKFKKNRGKIRKIFELSRKISKFKVYFNKIQDDMFPKFPKILENCEKNNKTGSKNKNGLKTKLSETKKFSTASSIFFIKINNFLILNQQFSTKPAFDLLLCPKCISFIQSI